MQGFEYVNGYLWVYKTELQPVHMQKTAYVRFGKQTLPIYDMSYRLTYLGKTC